MSEDASGLHPTAVDGLIQGLSLSLPPRAPITNRAKWDIKLIVHACIQRTERGGLGGWEFRAEMGLLGDELHGDFISGARSGS
jgi:hypothetical protein